jgi:large subunit ribosomal protein L17
MAHRIGGRKLSRKQGPRIALYRNLTVSILRYERVKTTEAKAKEIRRFVDKMINLGKDGSLEARRRARRWLPEQVIVEKVFDDLAKRYTDRNSGYLRMTHIARRVGDSAPLMLLELMPSVEETKTEAEAEAAPKRRRLALPGRRKKTATAETTKADKAESAPTKKRAPARKKTTAGAKEA